MSLDADTIVDRRRMRRKLTFWRVCAVILAIGAVVADGRGFTGRQGIALKLVDEIGDERAALAWLGKEKNSDPKTPVRDYRLRERFSDLPFLHTAMAASLDALGLSSLARRLEDWGA